MPIDDETLWEFAKDKDFRVQLAATVISRGLARQIRQMRAAKGWTQGEFAKRLDSTQAHVSRMERSCANVTIKTLCRVAAIFDVALIVRFESWSNFFAGLGVTDRPLSFDEEVAAGILDCKPHADANGQP